MARVKSSVPDSAAVVDASALVDLYANTPLAAAVRERLHGLELHAPAHVDAEVLSALGRLNRAGVLTTDHVTDCLQHLGEAPIVRHSLDDLLMRAWQERESLRLVDALYVALAEREDCTLLTTDRRLARASTRASVIASPG